MKRSNKRILPITPTGIEEVLPIIATHVAHMESFHKVTGAGKHIQ